MADLFPNLPSQQPPGYADKKVAASLSRRRAGFEDRQRTLDRWANKLEAAKRAGGTVYDAHGKVLYTAWQAEKKVIQAQRNVREGRARIGELEDQRYADWEPEDRLTPEGQMRIRRQTEG